MMMKKAYFQIEAKDTDGLTRKYLNDDNFRLRWNHDFRCWTYGMLDAYDSWEFLQYIDYMLAHPKRLRSIRQRYEKEYPQGMPDLMRSIARHGKINVPTFI